jgi:gamma-glutamyl hercynylcysteine S-oxide synthase
MRHGTAPLAERLTQVRDRTLALIAPLDPAWVSRTPDPIMSPPAWDLAHIAAYEELWLVTRLSGTPSLHPDLASAYDAFETPRAARGGIRILDGPQSRGYMDQVRERALSVLHEADISADAPELTANGFVWDMVAQHEAQHDETLLQTLQLMPPGAYAPCTGALPPGAGLPDAADPIALDGGTLAMGAPDGGRALDCERPVHAREVAPFRIDRTPVTIGRHLAFMEDGGYDDPRHWSPAGLEWRDATGARAPLHWHPDGAGGWVRTWFGCTEEVDPAEILCHISFFEAEAHARWAGGRLPTEEEWEFAARHDPASRDDAWAPWGDEGHEGRANLGQAAFRPARAGAYPAGVAPSGCAHMLGDVWEWTSTVFDAYPGFRAFPYREYAEPFFRRGYRVLRGGSWATQPVAARTTFRNWDLPERRQIFSGLRMAWDAA